MTGKPMSEQKKIIKLPDREVIIKKRAVPLSAKLDRPELREKIERLEILLSRALLAPQ